MIGVDDLERIAGDVVDGGMSGAEWLETSGIALEAMQDMLAAAERNFGRMVRRGDDPSDALVDVVGQAFRLGWETRHQYGRPDKPAGGAA